MTPPDDTRTAPPDDTDRTLVHADQLLPLSGTDGLPTVDGYTIIRELGRGGMGVVYEAVQTGLNRRVALKMVLNGRFTAADKLVRFLIEAEMLARLQHPNIVQIHEVGNQDGVPFFALEYVAGGTLNQYVRGTPLPPRQAAELVEQIARAVQHAHAHGVIHRDLKPGNILIAELGSRTAELDTLELSSSTHSAIRDPSSAIKLKVSDFGLAKQIDTADGVTATGAVMGTPAYMAPEQAGGKPVGPAADIYALGAVLCHLLTGRPPFQADSTAGTLHQVLNDPPPDPRTLNKDVPRDLAVICLKCLEKEPHRRYETAAALADDLHRYLTDRPITARPAGPGERAYRWCRRHPAEAGLLAALALVLAAGVAGVAVQWQEAVTERGNAVAAAGRLQEALTESEAHADRADKAAAAAETNFALAQDAVDKYLAGVSEDESLKETSQAKLRKRLIGTARDFYQKFADERKDDPTARAKLGDAYTKLADIAVNADADHAGGLAYARKSQAAFASLLKESPKSVPYRRAKLVADEWAASCLVRLGDADGGFALWAELTAGLTALAAETDDRGDLDRETFGWQRMGAELATANRYRPAVEAYRVYTRTMAGRADRFPTELKYLRSAAWGELRIGFCLRLLADPAAGPTLDAAAAKLRALRAADPAESPLTASLAAACYNGGIVAHLAGDDDAALKLFVEAADLYADYLTKRTDTDSRIAQANAYLYQAEIRLGRKQYDLAESLARQAVTAGGNGQVTAGAVGVFLGCYEKSGAKSALDLGAWALSAYRGSPPDSLTKNNLAWLYATYPQPTARDPVRAVGLARAAVQVKPADGAYLGTLGAAEYAAGNYPAARAALEKATGKAGSGVVNHFFLAMTLAKLGDRAGAKAEFEKADKADPGEEAEFARLQDEARGALGLGGTTVAAARTEYAVRWGLDRAGFLEWVKEMEAKKGWTPSAIHVHPTADGPRYTVLAATSRRAGRWEIKTDVGVDAFQRRFETTISRELQPACVCGFTGPAGGPPTFASVWSATVGPHMTTRHAADPEALLKEAVRMRATGGRIDSLSAYLLDGVPRYTTVYRADRAADSDVRLALDPAGYEAALADYRAKGWRPGPVAPLAVGGKPTFAVAGLADKTEWAERHGMTAAEAEAETARRLTAGYRPECVAGYEADGQDLYLAVWVKEPFVPPAPPPATGTAVVDLAGFDRTMQTFMTERAIPAGALAVMKDGNLVLSRGYGYLDRERTKPTPPDAPFRLASVTKPITAAAVRRLAADGKLSLDDKVQSLLGLAETSDPRWAEVTVAQLLAHRGGFDRAKGGDPMFQSAEIAAALKLAGPPTPADVVRFMRGRPLQFDPDTKSAYSNFGYCVLGRVIEAVSGKPYLDYVRDEVLAPVGVRGVELGRTLPADRSPREPWYSDPFRGKDVMHLPPAGPVPFPDGGFHLEAMDAHGGLIAPAPDLVRFLHHYTIDGWPAVGSKGVGHHFGSLPGTFTVMARLPNGVQVAALFNQRADPSGLGYDMIFDQLKAAAAGVKTWPATK